MRTLRRVGALATTGLFLTAFIGGSAGADTPAAYTASAKSSALLIDLPATTPLPLLAGRTQLSIGLSSAQGDSTPNAVAEGASALIGSQFQNQKKATVGQTLPETCAGALPAALANPVIQLGLGCSAASASVDGGYVNSSGSGSVAELDVSLDAVLSGAAAPATDLVQSTIDTVLTPICNLNPATCAVANTVDAVTDSLIETQTLAATIGKSTSSVTSNASQVKATGTADAASIQLLPEGVLDQVNLGAPVLDIQVAKASATVVCDTLTGVATNSIDPNLVRVKIAAPLFNAVPTEQIIKLGPPLTAEIGQAVINKTSAEVVIAPGQSVTLFAGLPIETDIVVAAGRKVDNADGTKSAIADGVKVHAAKGLNGGVIFDLAHAEATAGCSPAVVTPPPAAPVTPPAQELPRTGGMAILPVLGAAAFLAAVATRRALLARSN